MKKSFVMLSLFVLLLAAVPFAHPQPAYASCAINPYHGLWVNEKSSAALVTAVLIDSPCNDGGIYKHPMFYLDARCGSGKCSWGWSPGRREGQGYADARFWRNATTSQTFVLEGQNRLKVVTTASFNDGTQRTFTDFMRPQSLQFSSTKETRTVTAQFRVTWATGDGGGGNEFRPKIFFSSGNGNYYPYPKWKASQATPLSAGYEDLIFRLDEYDSGFNGGDDHFDINPDPNEKDIRVRVYLESGVIFLMQNGREVRELGKVGQPFTFTGKNGKDRAKVELVLQSSHVKPVLSLP